MTHQNYRTHPTFENRFHSFACDPRLREIGFAKNLRNVDRFVFHCFDWYVRSRTLPHAIIHNKLISIITDMLSTPISYHYSFSYVWIYTKEKAATCSVFENIYYQVSWISMIVSLHISTFSHIIISLLLQFWMGNIKKKKKKFEAAFSKSVEYDV